MTGGDARFDYLIVLGYKLRPDGSIAETLKLRLDKALEIIEQTNFRGNIIVSGGRPQGEGMQSEASKMKEYLVAHGISEGLIREEGFSKDTFGNLSIIKAQLGNESNFSLCIVTSITHIERVGIILDWFYGNGYKVSFVAAPNPPSKIRGELEYERNELNNLSTAMRELPWSGFDLIERTEKEIKFIDGVLGKSDADLKVAMDRRVVELGVFDRRYAPMLRKESTEKQVTRSRG